MIMAAYRVELTRLCQTQIKTIYRHLADDLCNPRAADRFLDETMALAESLEEFPYRYAVRPESLKYGAYAMRQICYVMNYTAYYVIDKSNRLVTIAEIRYSKRDSSDL